LFDVQLTRLVQQKARVVVEAPDEASLQAALNDVYTAIEMGDVEDRVDWALDWDWTPGEFSGGHVVLGEFQGTVVGEPDHTVD